MSEHEDDHEALLRQSRRATHDDPEALSSHFEVQVDFQPQPDEDEPLYARFAMYASHALSTWGQRMWEFAVGLIMLELYPSSLVLVSAFGLADALAKVFSGSLVGSYIDR